MPSLHRHTPSLIAIDPRRAVVRSVAYHRLHSGDTPKARITCNVWSASGYLLEQWDPRFYALQLGDPSVLPNISHRYSLSGLALSTDSIDAGRSVALFGSGGQPIQRWDGRGARTRHEYDSLLRPIALFEQASNDQQERCVERLTYGAVTSELAENNCCGRLTRHDDTAGCVNYDHYALMGSISGESRRFALVPGEINWSVVQSLRESALRSERFSSSWQYTALGAVREQIDAKGNRHLSQYGPEGELTQVSLLLNSGKRKVVLDHRIYNAMGLVIKERAGNGMITEVSYNEADGSLQRLASYRSERREHALQDLTYGYDRVGNVCSINDAAQPTTWTSNAKVNAISLYEYDTLYQLIHATGRENAQHNGGPALPGWVMFGAPQSNLWRNYTRQYQYDAGGNLLQMRHVPSSGQGYTQRMHVALNSNRSILYAKSPFPDSSFDRCGNQLMLAQSQSMEWNVRNQLTRLNQVLRDDAEDDMETYTYDAGGMRVLKCRSSKAMSLTHTREVIYLPGLELRRDHALGQWFTVVSVDTGRATVKALLWEKGRPRAVDDEQLRFCLSDPLGSCSLELDEQAALLSQEGYYPYGATAWCAAKNSIEVTFKTFRYSGKERDATGLYYYGLRYYAPWLQRWISPDPGYDINGLNLYRMVNNNPMTLRDMDGRQGVGMTQRVLLGLAFIPILAGLGAGLGWAVAGEPAIGASLGALLGVSILALLLHEGYQRESRRALLNSPDHRQRTVAKWLSECAVYIAESRGLTHEETNRLVNFFYQQQHDDEKLSIQSHTTAEGKIYAFIGPATSQERLNQLIELDRPIGKELRQLGYSHILLREPAREVVAQSSATSGLSRFDVQGSTPLAKRKVVKGESAPASTRKQALATGSSTSAFSVDTSEVAHLMSGREGRSIAITLGHLNEGRMAAVHWHKHRDDGDLWSADLHGFPGAGKRRSAYRLMFEHLGARTYRVAGIRDPH